MARGWRLKHGGMGAVELSMPWWDRVNDSKKWLAMPREAEGARQERAEAMMDWSEQGQVKRERARLAAIRPLQPQVTLHPSPCTLNSKP